VRHIFKRFVQLGSTTELVRELNAKRMLTKSWITAKGRFARARAGTRPTFTGFSTTGSTWARSRTRTRSTPAT